MFELRGSLTAFRDIMAAACLALLAGCIPEPPDTLPAAAPASLAATAGNATVALAWTASSSATAYSVKRATASGGPYTQLATPNSAGYTDNSVANGTTYFYVVTALNEGGESPSSAQASATPTIPSIPPVPTGLTATAGDRQVSLSWSASSGATSYRVKRAATRGGPYAQVGAPTSATYADTLLTNGTTYHYVVSAVNSTGESANSTAVSATPSPPPPTTFGSWMDVTPSNVNLADTSCGTAGTSSIQVDAANPSNLYVQFHCQGIWRSVDYGASWSGPINTGTNGAIAGDCDGGIAISPTSTASVPTIFQFCIRGNGTGFWKSVDGGVNWVRYVVGPTTRQDYLTPAVDPYDPNHLLMTGHEFDSLVESVDGGQTWAAVSVNNGMLTSGRNSFVFFVDTGNAVTTRATWLFAAESSGGAFGTWRTTDRGTSWVQVDRNEIFSGNTQIYQPDKSGIVFVAGANSALGSGVLRSTDYGQTWSHVGRTTELSVVIGTAKNVYAMCGCADKKFAVSSQPGTGQWVEPGTPASLSIGAGQLAVVNDVSRSILVGAMGASGVWRYVEP